MKTLEQLRADRKLQTPTVTPTPTIAPAQPSSPTPQMTTAAKQKMSTMASKATRPLQQGLGVVSDVLNALEYPIAGFQKGAWEEGQKIKAEKGLTRRIATPGEAARRIWAGIKNIPSGFKERTTLTETVPKMLEDVGVKNKAVQAGAGLVSSLSVPSLPIGKIAKATKLETAVPKLLGKAVEVGEKTPVVGKAIEFGKKFIRSESAPQRFLSKYDEYQRNLSKAAEQTQEVIRPLLYDEKGKKLPEQTQRVIQDILGLSEENKSAGKNIQKLYHGTSGEFDSIKTMRQLRKEGSLVEPSNIGGNSPFIHLTEDKNIANQYAKSRAINMGGTPSVKEINVSGNILDLTKHPSEYSSQEKEKFLKMGQKLIDLSGNRGSDARLGTELKNLGRVPKHTMDSRLPYINYFDIEQSHLFPEIIKEFGDSGIKFTDKGIAAGTVNTIAVLPESIAKELPISTKKISKAVTPEELTYIKKYGQIADTTLAKFKKLAEEDIRAGADPKIYERFLGKYYGKRTFEKVIEKQAAKETPSFIKSKEPRLDLSLYKERKDLPEEIQKELGKIQTPAYGAALSYFGTKKNIATRDFYKWIAKNYVDKGEDLVALPKSEKLGILSGRKVPRQIYENLNQIVNPPKYNESYAKAIQFFKKGKTILSPKQLIRNIPASLMQMYMNPSGRADAIRRVPEAISEIKSRGKFYKEFKSVGGIGQTQIGEVFSQAIPRELEKFKGKTTYDKVIKAIETPGATMQGFTEDVAKLSVYINERKAGKSVMDALKAAEETGFNYQKVSPFVQRLRSGKTGIGMSIPFITYPMKAAELTAKTLYKQPQRLKNIGSVERSIQNLSEPGNEQYLPDYLQQAVRTPFKSPRTGNQLYANLKYLYPYGNLLEGGTPLGLTPDPLLSEAVTQLLTKRDVYQMMQALQDGRDPMSVKQLSDSEIMGMKWSAPIRHLLETIGPTPVRSLFKWVDSQTKQKVSATAPSGLETVLQEAGMPIYQYSPATGASVQSYQRAQKIKEAKSELDKYMREAKPGTVGYQMGLEAKRKAWMDALSGK